MEEQKKAQLSRVNSVQKKANTKTLGQQFHEQLNSLMSTLQACDPHYVRCLKPNTAKKPNLFTTEMVLRQMKYAGLFEAIRIRKSGFPVRNGAEEFAKKFTICLSSSEIKMVNSENLIPAKCKLIIEMLKEHLNLNEIQMGQTKVFMRNSQRNVLCKLRENALTKIVLKLQALARGMSSRTKFSVMKTLHASSSSAMASRSITELSEVLGKSYELRIELLILKSVSKLKEFLEREKRITEMLLRAVSADSLDICEAGIAEAASIDSDYPEERENHVEEFREAILAVNSRKEFLVRLQNARTLLKDAVVAEKIPDLVAALAEAAEVGLTVEETKEASSLLEHLEREERLMKDLMAAIDNNLGTEELEKAYGPLTILTTLLMPTYFNSCFNQEGFANAALTPRCRPSDLLGRGSPRDPRDCPTNAERRLLRAAPRRPQCNG